MSAEELYDLLLAEVEAFEGRTGASPAWRITGSTFGTPGSAGRACLLALAEAVAARWPREPVCPAK